MANTLPSGWHLAGAIISALGWMIHHPPPPPPTTFLLASAEQSLAVGIVREPSPCTIYQHVAVATAYGGITTPLPPVARPLSPVARPLSPVLARPTASVGSGFDYPADNGFAHYGEGPARLSIVDPLLVVFFVLCLLLLGTAVAVLRQRLVALREEIKALKREPAVLKRELAVLKYAARKALHFQGQRARDQLKDLLNDVAEIMTETEETLTEEWRGKLQQKRIRGGANRRKGTGKLNNHLDALKSNYGLHYAQILADIKKGAPNNPDFVPGGEKVELFEDETERAVTLETTRHEQTHDLFAGATPTTPKVRLPPANMDTQTAEPAEHEPVTWTTRWYPDGRRVKETDNTAQAEAEQQEEH